MPSNNKDNLAALTDIWRMHISQRSLFLAHQAQTTPFPLMLEMDRAEGVYIQDVNGKRYLDLISGIGVSSLGHGHEAVKAAIKAQVDKHMHLMVYGEFIQSPQVKLAQQLTEALPKELDCVYFVNSGAEAVEGAMKLAKRVTGRKEILAFKQAYHGSTQGAMSLNSDPYFTGVFEPLLPEVGFLEFNSFEALNRIHPGTACVVVETVRGESGYAEPAPGFLKALESHCREAGTLLVLDEIQCGMGRTGTLFAFEQEGVTPDILLLGKALGGGMPIGAFISSRKHMLALSDQPILGHITTFGGHPVVCAAASAAFEALHEGKWMEEVAWKSSLFRELLQHRLIKGITGRGLMLGVEFESFDLNKTIIDGCLNDGLITDWFLFASHKMRIAPPLIISETQIREACKIILKNCVSFERG